MKKILDIGCGEGSLINSLNKKDKKKYFYGIDISSDNIRKCKQFCGAKNLFFKRGKAEKLDFEDDYFDEIYCMEVLEHVDNIDKSMSEITRVLKKKGILTLSVPLKESEDILKEINPDYPNQVGHKRFFSKRSLLSLLKKNNFLIKEYSSYDSMEHIYWKHAFKKGRKIISQLGVIDKKLWLPWRIALLLFSKEIVLMRSNTKNFIHYLMILILHLGYPFGRILDKFYVNKKQRIVCINNK
jgi:SAM-dependent methyltransferase